MQLYDQFNRPVKATKAPERRPLAVAPILDSWREYVASGLTPERLGSIFREADAGDIGRQAQLFDQVEERDGHLLGERSKRSNVILDVDFDLQPASDDSRDVKVAEFVEDFIGNASEWDDVLVGMQDSVGKGFSAFEIFWDVSSGQALPEKFEFLEQQRFLFTGKDGILRRTPLLLSDDNLMGDEIPAWKVMLHQYGGKTGHPTRSGVFRVCAWMYLFKNYSIKDWVVFCEVYGMPLRLGKYAASAGEDEKAALVQAISSLGTDAAGIISKDAEIEFVETVGSTAKGDLYKDLASFCNAEMSKAILGQTLTAEVGDVGSYAAANTHNDVRLDLLRADGRAVAATIRNQIIRPIVGFNFGWDTPLPKYKALWEEEDDLNKKSEWLDKVMDRTSVPRSFVYQEFNIPEREGDEEMVGGPAAETSQEHGREIAAKESAAATAGGFPDQDALDGLIESLGPDFLQGQMDGVLKSALRMITEGGSYEDILTQLNEDNMSLDTAEIEGALTRAIFLSETWGRLNGEN